MTDRKKPQDLSAEDLDMAVGGTKEGGGGIGKGIIMEGMEDPEPLTIHKGEESEKLTISKGEERRKHI